MINLARYKELLLQGTPLKEARDKAWDAVDRERKLLARAELAYPELSFAIRARLEEMTTNESH